MQSKMLSELERTINARRRLYLLRHGDVSYFDDDGMPYKQDEVSLNDDGRRQAKAAADALVDARLDRIVVSGLPRTVQTAAYLRDGRDIEVAVREGLREIEPGRMDDHPPAELETMFTNALRTRLERDTRFLGGETFGSLLDRVLPTFESLLEDSTWNEMAIVAHGGTNRAILCRCLGAELTTFASLEQDPACINVIDVDESGAFLVRLINFTPWSPTKHDLRATTMERIWLSHIAPRLANGKSDGKSDEGTDPSRGPSPSGETS
jgi:probable phosphoglycerate mutase